MNSYSNRKRMQTLWQRSTWTLRWSRYCALPLVVKGVRKTHFPGELFYQPWYISKLLRNINIRERKVLCTPTKGVPMDPYSENAFPEGIFINFGTYQVLIQDYLKILILAKAKEKLKNNVRFRKSSIRSPYGP